MQCPGKKLINTCSSDEAYYYKVNCTKRTAIVSAKLIATSGDGSVLATKDSTNTTDSTKCSDRSDTLESESSLLSKLLNTASLELVADFIPVHKQRPSDLIDESEEFEEADAKILSLASELAAKNDLVKADGLYKELLSRYPHHAGLVFNLGYVNHALGNFELAADYYSKALQLAGDESANEDFAEYAKEAQAWVNKGITQVKK
jgi:tetratricopeptide (TPR) repeat protein